MERTFDNMTEDEIINAIVSELKDLPKDMRLPMTMVAIESMLM